MLCATLFDPKPRWPFLLLLTALLACALTTTSCATKPPSAAAQPPPRVETPPAAAESCSLYTLPERPTEADLELGYVTRGAQLVVCEGRRQLAVATHAAEHRLEDEWAAERDKRNKPWWRFW